jgi:RHH-type proline utilization regulon transcriptional repressor/proline dehydrogenase/delta 1-pyrroline-5-carboxylate dehydrogenase
MSADMSPRPRAFDHLGQELRPIPPLRQAIHALTRADEARCVQQLLPAASLTPEQAEAARQRALALATGLRQRKTSNSREGLVQAMMQEFSLSSQEGIALMCLAEALLRIPDEATRDALIRDKVAEGNWVAHLGRSPSMFINAATWGLVLTGRLVGLHTESGLRKALRRVATKGGEPLIRKAVDVAMRLLGEQFVMGETIGAALRQARERESQGYRHSYDMLGEAALSADDALRYHQAYADAITAIGRSARGTALHDRPGISIKLSALHPRYTRSQYGRVLDELYPRLLELATRACQHNIGLNIDAEESDRLDLSLDLLERLCFAPELAGWHGIGFVVQAYQKRAPAVIDFLIDLARASGHRLMVRLVKGAYWDSEIKRAQVEGQRGYPVYTRKAHTDIAYLACARQLLTAQALVFPQFATHNAHTLAAILQLAGPGFQPGDHEFQCLHGMGEPLYDQVVASPDAGGLGRPCRIYAPVGPHDTLLAYLVRRLLENGANSSFVNQAADASVALDSLVANPVDTVRAQARNNDPLGQPHPAIALPAHLFGKGRLNSSGLDLNDEPTLHTLHAALMSWHEVAHVARPLLAATHDEGRAIGTVPRPATSPADTCEIVGTVMDAAPEDVAPAAQAAAALAEAWAATPVAHRAAALQRAADRYQDHLPQLVHLLVREAGKTLPNAVAEVREAIDFLRYAATQARDDLRDGLHQPLGPIVCISPWNFPLAIFTGQIAVALAAGNPVLAKPAEQTPLVATLAVSLLHDSGIPRGALQLLPGPGETIGAALVARPEVAGVLFTGSTAVARGLQQSLSTRLNARGLPPLLVAETGGQNAMIVDSSALPEQVVQDVLTSAFDSAGQRCSALRLLCLQSDVADRVLQLLRGAMDELQLGRPDRLSTDVGPLIDEAARGRIQSHLAAMTSAGHTVHTAPRTEQALPALTHGHFLAPALIEIDRVSELREEVFGPVLHVLRYEREALPELMAQIRATGHGLTMGVHSRIDDTIDAITAMAHVGNLYVNRNIVGAVVGVQPFGGEGLSGTGPKAGGPLLLHRLLHANADTTVSDATLRRMATHRPNPARLTALHDLLSWLDDADLPHTWALRSHGRWLTRHALSGLQATLPGPTGERNTYCLLAREGVLCLADDPADLVYQLLSVLAADSMAIWPRRAALQPLWQALPAAVQARVRWTDDWQATPASPPWSALLLHGRPDEIQRVARWLAERPGPVLPLHAAPRGWRQPGAFPVGALLRELSVSANTTAAGGNASLLTLNA